MLTLVKLVCSPLGLGRDPVARSLVFCVMSLFVLFRLVIASSLLLRFTESSYPLVSSHFSYVNIISCNICQRVLEFSTFFKVFLWAHIIVRKVDYCFVLVYMNIMCYHCMLSNVLNYVWTFGNRTHAGLFENVCQTTWLPWLYY